MIDQDLKCAKKMATELTRLTTLVIERIEDGSIIDGYLIHAMQMQAGDLAYQCGLCNGKVAAAVATPCSKVSPTTGQLCTMVKGHAGPHKVGGPYHVVEEFVIKCAGSCDYHFNSCPDIRTPEQSKKWLECIRCGHTMPLPALPASK